MKTQRIEYRMEDFQAWGTTVGKPFGRLLAQQTDPFLVPDFIHSMFIEQDRSSRWPRGRRKLESVWEGLGESGGVGKVTIPSEVLSAGLHWQYRWEKCVRTRSRSCVSPISGKAFRKVLKGNSRMLRTSQSL